MDDSKVEEARLVIKRIRDSRRSRSSDETINMSYREKAQEEMQLQDAFKVVDKYNEKERWERGRKWDEKVKIRKKAEEAKRLKAVQAAIISKKRRVPYLVSLIFLLIMIITSIILGVVVSKYCYLGMIPAVGIWVYVRIQIQKKYHLYDSDITLRNYEQLRQQYSIPDSVYLNMKEVTTGVYE